MNLILSFTVLHIAEGSAIEPGTGVLGMWSFVALALVFSSLCFLRAGPLRQLLVACAVVLAAVALWDIRRFGLQAGIINGSALLPVTAILACASCGALAVVLFSLCFVSAARARGPLYIMAGVLAALAWWSIRIFGEVSSAA